MLSAKLFQVAAMFVDGVTLGSKEGQHHLVMTPNTHSSLLERALAANLKPPSMSIQRLASRFLSWISTREVKFVNVHLI